MELFQTQRTLNTLITKEHNMFTQTLGLNTNRCNGCSEHCTLGTVPSKRKKEYFIPTIKGIPRAYYYDKNNIRHNLRPQPDKNKVIDTARLISSLCPKYNRHHLITETETNQCAGCAFKCKLDSTEINGEFIPKIKNTIIYTYINAYGVSKKIIPLPDATSAQELAKRIARRCDFYRANIKIYKTHNKVKTLP